MFGKRNSSAAEDRATAPATARPQAAPAPVTQQPPPPPPAANPAGAMEGGRAPIPSAGLGAPLVSAPTAGKRHGGLPNEPAPPLAPTATDSRHSSSYYETKGTIFGALIEAIDLSQLAKLDAEAAREEIRDIVNEIIAIKSIVMSISEQEELLDDICNDVLGYGPLEPLLSRDDIADIMVNGSGTTYIEVKGKIQKTGIRFRDNQQLLNICQRIVSQIGRRVDESSPICDARLPDGSRVNVIVPPLAIDGPALTIRKFKKDKLTLDQLVRFGSITPEGAEILKVIGRCRVNTIISGGTGSGKTTLLNCLTAVHRPRRAHHHVRRRSRIAVAAAAHRTARNAPAEPRRRRPGHHARPGQELPAYAPGTHHRGRGARTGGIRPAAGDEHRP